VLENEDKISDIERRHGMQLQMRKVGTMSSKVRRDNLASFKYERLERKLAVREDAARNVKYSGPRIVTVST